VASYLSAGKGHGTKTDGSTGCDNFKYGSPGRCKLSGAIVAFGVIEMLLFAATAFISCRAVMSYKRTGIMPMPGGGGGQLGRSNTAASRTGKSNYAQTQDAADAAADADAEAFSSNMRSDDDDVEDEQNRTAKQGPTPTYDVYAPLHQNDHDEMAHMSGVQPHSSLAQSGLGIHGNTAYGGAGGRY
jgi:hypothetical protein